MASGNLAKLEPERIKRSKVFYFGLFVVLSALFIYLLLSFKSLILPTIIGFISAYVVMPIVTILRRMGIPKWLALVILFAGFTFLVFIVGKKVASIIPNEMQQLELRVQVQYKVNEEFMAITGRDSLSGEGNFLITAFGDEIDPVINTFNEFIALSEDEKAVFNEYLAENDSSAKIEERIIAYYQEVSKLPFPTEEEEEITEEIKSSFLTAPNPQSDSKIAKFVSALSNWIVLPFVFLFLLLDEGEIKKAFIGVLPNRYFEMSLTIFDNVDTAIGNYLRGTLMQCSLVGIGFIVGLSIIGFEFQAAVLIGVLAGIANAIPFLGPVLGLGIGFVYAMIVDGINPYIPFISIDPIIGVVIVVVAVQALDNAIFQPLVLGKAVNLHPLVVVLGVTGGSILFGFAGMLLAIPTIVVFKVIISTIYKQFKLYYIIY